MTELPEDELFERHAELCQVLGNAKRLKILHVLREEERTVTEIADLTEIPQPTVSQHLRKMRDKNVVTKRSEGNRSYYRVRDERIFEATKTIRRVLHDMLAEQQQLGADA